MKILRENIFEIYLLDNNKKGKTKIRKDTQYIPFVKENKLKTLFVFSL